jgi:hypothetical protein
MDELRERLNKLVNAWRDEDCSHAWAKLHAKRAEPAELICAEEVAAILAQSVPAEGAQASGE